ncbi:hypothetical protein HanIR_Chr00c36g0912511 [Helianthus annuus]|nr:hypothetical protein HanIR_Chr00c36g0912511 [Helianthus annuus]
MASMISFRLRIDKDIINKNYNETTQIGFANTVHKVHEHGGCISQTKRHDHELVVPIWSTKHIFRNIFFENT